MSNYPPAIFIMGPTASGKTDLALALFDRFPCELISVDSALVYRDMNIGTAKPSAEILAQYPHHLVDVIEPTDVFSAARFRDAALALMEQITARGRMPVLVGGTMLYYRALQHGLAELPDANQNIREEMEVEAQRIGWQEMHARLALIDPESAARIHPNDPQRIQRALEVYEITGRSLSDLYQQQKRDSHLPYNVTKIVVAPEDRAVLHERIAFRFKRMLNEGFIDEVVALRARGDLNLSLPSMRAVGYRQVWQHLDGDLSYDEMVEKGVVATRQLAKRQFTWLRSETNVTWFDSQLPNLQEKVLKSL